MISIPMLGIHRVFDWHTQTRTFVSSFDGGRISGTMKSITVFLLE